MYSFSSKVRYSECDERSQLSIPALINYLQDCSTFHTESLGHGVAFLAEHHFAWFITAWHIEILRMPRYTEDITVSTWCHTLKATHAGRFFTIINNEGNLLVQANSQWVVVDTTTGKPIRVPEGEDIYLTDDEPLDMPPIRRKLKLSGTPVPKGAFEVTEQQLDTNHHVNNAQYVLMADNIIREHDADFVAGSILVQYKQPAMLGDLMQYSLYVEETGYAVDMTNEDGGSYCIVRMLATSDAGVSVP